MATKKKVAEADIVSEEKAGVEEAPALRVHIVRKGDTLRNIARFYLGDARRAEEIKAKNNLATDILLVGRELTIPER